MKADRSAEQRPIKVLIVDDHPLTSLGLKAASEASTEFQIVGETTTADGLVELVERLKPDVVTMDIRLGGGVNGIEAARQLSERFPNLKLLMLSAFDAEPYVQQAHRIGVHGYILKSASPSSVLNSIRIVADGGIAFAPEAINRLIKHPEMSADYGASFARPVTSREAELLQLLADGLTNQEIARRLSVSRSAVDAQLKNIFNKLGVRTRTAAVVRAVQLGLIVIEDSVTFEAKL